MSVVPFPPRYVSPETIGEGATGVVYRVWDTTAQEYVAVKVVRKHLAVLERFRARFSREVALSARLVHPNIVPVRDFGRLADGAPYVVMDYAAGGSFSDLLRRPHDLSLVLALIDDVLASLAHLHARGLVHRDIKPENVLLHGRLPTDEVTVLDRPRAWVADFGLAGARTEVAFTGEMVAGTREWMAPEQADGRVQDLGPWTDLYAVGLVLHTALGGTPVRLQRDAHGRFVPNGVHLPSDVDAGLAEIVRTLLHPDPFQRYDRAADVRRALAEVQRSWSRDHRGRSAGQAVLPTSSTTFPMPLEIRGLAAVTNLRPQGAASATPAPRWNRVAPGSLPERIPLAEGWGATSHALDVVSLRDPMPPASAETWATMWEAARRVVALGRPQVLLLVGRDGSGKGRLADVLAETLEEGGWMESVTLRYHDPPAEDDGFRGGVLELLVPWNDARADAERRIANWIARDRGVGQDAVADEAQALARWCGYRNVKEAPANAGLGLAYLLRHLDARAWRGGAVLVLQDAHHAPGGAEGLEICRAILEETVGTRPILVVATLSRDALAENAELAADVDSLVALGAERIDVHRLDNEAMSGFLQHEMQFDPALAVALAPRCAGSPTFATLLFRDLVLRKLVMRNPAGRLVLSSEVDLDLIVPRTMEDLAIRRVDGAIRAAESPSRCSHGLSATAIAGQAPPALVVRAASGDALDEVLGTGLVRQRGFRLVFEAQAIREAVARRSEAQANVATIHRSLAKAWEELGATVGVDVDLALGRHRLGANEYADAVTPLLRAARSNIAAGRPELALVAGRLALDAAMGADRRMARVEARQQMAEALLELDRASEAADLLKRTGEDWQMDRRSKARDCVLWARAAMAVGEFPTAARLLDWAATAYEATQDRAGQIETAHGQAILQRLSGHPLAAAERYSRVLRLNRSSDMHARVSALAGRIECLLTGGRHTAVHKDLLLLQETARRSQDTRNIARAAYVSGLVLHDEGKNFGSERQLRTALALAATIGDDRLLVDCHNVLGEVARALGDDAEARERYQHAVRVSARRGWRRSEAVAHINLCLLALDRSRREAEHEHAAAAALVSTDNGHWVRIFVCLVSAIWATEDGNIDVAREQLQQSVEAGLARLPMADARRLLERLAARARTRGAVYLAARAQELGGDLQITDTDADIAVHRLGSPLEDAADQPTEPLTGEIDIVR